MDIGVLRAFRVLRLVAHLRYLDTLDVVGEALHRHRTLLTSLVALFLALLALFAVLGLELFHGKLQGRCVQNGTGDTPRYRILLTPLCNFPGLLVLPEQFCQPGGYHSCSERLQHRCDTGYGGPHGGLASFQDGGSALVLLYQAHPSAYPPLHLLNVPHRYRP